MQVEIYKCPQDFVANLFPIVDPWLEGSLKTAPLWWKLSDLHRMCVKGDYVLWLILVDKKPQGVALSSLDTFDGGIVCGVPWIGGKRMPIWFAELQRIIEWWGRDAGAKYLLGSGRKAWARLAGMRHYGSLLVKEL